MTYGPFVKSVILSKNTVYRERQSLCYETAKLLKTQFKASKFFGMANFPTYHQIAQERLIVLVSSLQDGSTKLLNVPKLMFENVKATTYNHGWVNTK